MAYRIPVNLLNGKRWYALYGGAEYVPCIAIPIDQIGDLDDASLASSIRIAARETGKCEALDYARSAIAQINNPLWWCELSCPGAACLFNYRDFDPRIQTTWSLIHRRSENRQTATEKTPDPGFVYLLKSGPYYKIGLSKQVDDRICQLRTLPPFDIELIHTIKTQYMHDLERCLHDCFAPYRKNGEWFTLSDEHVIWIKGIEMAKGNTP